MQNKINVHKSTEKLDIVFYKSKKGHFHIDVRLTEDTVWLSINQMARLFNRDKSVISRHLTNLFKNKELKKKEVVAKFATTSSDHKTYQVNYYNLDAIIFVGFKVNSKKGILFRKWATRKLQEHFVKGFTIHKKQITEQGLKELNDTILLLKKNLAQQDIKNDINSKVIQIIQDYSKTWHLLCKYDENKLHIPKKIKSTKTKLFTEKSALTAITLLKDNLDTKKLGSNLFAVPSKGGLNSIINSLEQTFNNISLYKSVEEKAAHLLYFVIKDHPFVDGNKRIGCFLFLVYLQLHKLPLKINDNGLITLALLVAESAPSQKELIIKLVINMLIE